MSNPADKRLCAKRVPAPTRCAGVKWFDKWGCAKRLLFLLLGQSSHHPLNQTGVSLWISHHWGISGFTGSCFSQAKEHFWGETMNLFARKLWEWGQFSQRSEQWARGSSQALNTEPKKKKKKKGRAFKVKISSFSFMQ